MQFTRLRLSGFKSFVDPTEVQIHPGLTGVVGPNGCGKSNLLEALRWVMGENRPSAMRGSGMEDVVFNGSGRRAAKANAEVVLSVDNTARTAPAGFNDADVLDVARKLTRDLGSSYKINGREVRARDVQILFADAATGAHSPALVRQGQISELINAKPRARRRVLEDAAGIAGLYQRRHEAELRLNATEANLARVADTLDQFAQQLAVLHRQARQAMRYREIAGQLRRFEGVFLLRRWSEAEAALTEAQRRLTDAIGQAGALARAVDAAAAAREGAEAALPPLRDEAAIAAAVVARIEVEAEALAQQEARAAADLRDLTAQIARLEGDAAREAALAADADASLARLVAEGDDLTRAALGEGAQIAAARACADTAGASLAGLEADLTRATEAAAVLAARRQAVEAALTSARADLARAEGAVAQTLRDAALARDRCDQTAQDVSQTATTLTEAQGLSDRAEATLAQAEAARVTALSAEADARAAAAALRGEAQALESEAGGLERLLARPDAGGTGVLAQITVSPGYERALGAALADDLRLPVSATGSGWRALPPLDTPPVWPAGVEPLAPHVTAPPALARRLACVALADPARAVDLHAGLAPGQRLVSRAGDLWRWDGVAVPAGQAPSAAALRLEQVNRLAALRETLTEARARAEASAAAHRQAADRLARLTEAERAGREARRQADRRSAEAVQAAGRAETAADLAASRLVLANAAAARAAAERAEAQARLAAAQAQSTAEGPDALSRARAAQDDARAAVDAARRDAGRLRGIAQGLVNDAAARARRQSEIARDRQGWSDRQAQAAARLSDLAARQADLTRALSAARARPDDLAQTRRSLSDSRAAAQDRRTRATAALSDAEAALRTAQDDERQAGRAAGAAGEARAAAEARVEAARAAMDTAAARILDERGQTPEALQATCAPDEGDLPQSTSDLETEIARLRRARDALGAVNLRADEDARVLQAEQDDLIAQRADLDAAVTKLRSAIAALNREGRERLLTAFDQVNANFATLFTHLFGGGEARLVLVESDDPLEAGLEILCQPPGKKLSQLSLLSGGEQTLTALALIFGVFLTNPSPICVLDEVDAPLDDANVARFCDLLDEMTRRTDTRFLIITHNPITMARMDRLYGVTMVEQGVSQLVSVDLKRAEALVA